MPQGKVAIVTGSTSGIGKEVARHLSLLENEYSTVIYACRNFELGESLANGQNCKVLQLDLSRLSSVDQFMEDFEILALGRVDTLVLNAGIGSWSSGASIPRVTADGFDEMLQVNFISHFYLLLKLKKYFHPHQSRVVCLSSQTHWYANGNRMDQICSPTKPTFMYYFDSKLYLTILSFEIRRKGICDSVAVSPGAVATNIFRNSEKIPIIGKILSILIRKCFLSPRDGAATVIEACTMSSLPASGYLTPYGQWTRYGSIIAALTDLYWFRLAPKDRFEGISSPASRDVANGEALWNISIQALESRITHDMK
jgi:NAD(P)-dependent dehydrogenase (short-subunit alcohol dehydrogenase family)